MWCFVYSFIFCFKKLLYSGRVLHILRIVDFKCTVQWMLVSLHSWQLCHNLVLEHFYHQPWNFPCGSLGVNHLSLLMPQVTTELFSVYKVLLSLDISYKWNSIVCSYLFLLAFLSLFLRFIHVVVWISGLILCKAE